MGVAKGNAGVFVTLAKVTEGNAEHGVQFA